MAEAKWYVAHTYSGYENKVKSTIEKSIENQHLEEQILEVIVPMMDTMETKDGKSRSVSKKMFPGYVIVHMVMNDETWYVVRNTRGVTGFVGPGSKPVPLSDEEVKKMLDSGAEKESVIEVDFSEGDILTVVSGTWEGTDGKVLSINTRKQSVTIEVDLFGRNTPVEVGFADVRKMN